MAIEIKTDNKPRELLFFRDLTFEEQKELDYVVDQDTNSFVRYKGVVYDLGEFQRIVHQGETKRHICEVFDLDGSFAKWDAIYSDSFFSGIVIRYKRDENGDIDAEEVVIGTYIVTENKV